MAIKIDPDSRKQHLASIKRYFAERLDQEIGDLKAGLILDYFLAEIGPTVYNRAIADAQAWFVARAGDLEAVCYEREFAYWGPDSKSESRPPPSNR